ncbi:Uncharacterized protein dnl_53090 [Desulfonema limicola]|uniref:Uncharacterized protein n=1 Tax=Desulfonema limicola TaxID=45656 RepID=A0A975BCT9_9BACT|nr:hypothetical protein [Desulfonema limicola]QTA82923.1 Uncharacterized protein dnl_53090 [Desulfonema limicola]
MNKNKYKQILVKAYFEKENLPVKNGWQDDVMRHIRSIEQHGKKFKEEISNFIIFEQYLWKFIPAACVLALILFIYIFQSDFQAEYELAKLFLNDPLDFNLMQSFGIL